MAAVCNKCLVFALPRHQGALKLAMHALIVPTLAEAMQLASGASPARNSRPSMP
jgi:molybdopterin biosynthesis enzyme MoaB